MNARCTSRISTLRISHRATFLLHSRLSLLFIARLGLFIFPVIAHLSCQLHWGTSLYKTSKKRGYTHIHNSHFSTSSVRIPFLCVNVSLLSLPSHSFSHIRSLPGHGDLHHPVCASCTRNFALSPVQMRCK